MQEEIHAAFRGALPRAFELLLPLLAQRVEPYIRIERMENGWQTRQVQRPSFLGIAQDHQEELAQLGSSCIDAIRRHRPEYLGQVGSASSGRMPIFHDPAHLLRALVYRHAIQQGTAPVNPEQVHQLIRAVELFIDDPHIHFRCIVELLHFQMEAEFIALPNGLSIRRLSDDEVSEMHGGDYWNIVNPFLPRDTVCGYAVTAQFSEPKLFNDSPPSPSSEYADLISNLDQVLIALRTFKAGETGFSTVRMIGPEFFGPRASFGRTGDLPVPMFGNYRLDSSEIDRFRQHASYVFAKLDSALELACSRLSDAETRNRPQDRLLDAVIGLEAVLLAVIGPDDRRGELVYRFAMNYSTFFNGAEERFRQSLIARDLYAHRSKIAHGGTVKGENLKLGEERVSLPAAARRACDMLRLVINRFLPEGTSPAFRTTRWWERQLFGLETGHR
jgi:hypothetical protein